jgi:hypothetical protein
VRSNDLEKRVKEETSFAIAPKTPYHGNYSYAVVAITSEQNIIAANQ